VNADAGSYPEWPYAGALMIESADKETGIDEIRSFIKQTAI
jgi:hypothetical protein